MTSCAANLQREQRCITSVNIQVYRHRVQTNMGLFLGFLTSYTATRAARKSKPRWSASRCSCILFLLDYRLSSLAPSPAYLWFVVSLQPPVPSRFPLHVFPSLSIFLICHHHAIKNIFFCGEEKCVHIFRVTEADCGQVQLKGNCNHIKCWTEQSLTFETLRCSEEHTRARLWTVMKNRLVEIVLHLKEGEKTVNEASVLSGCRVSFSTAGNGGGREECVRQKRIISHLVSPGNTAPEFLRLKSQLGKLVGYCCCCWWWWW